MVHLYVQSIHACAVGGPLLDQDTEASLEKSSQPALFVQSACCHDIKSWRQLLKLMLASLCALKMLTGLQLYL